MASPGPLRVLLDVNVWIANLIASDKGRQGTAAQQLVSMIARGEWGTDGRSVQLVVSIEMLATLDSVMRRRGASPRKAEAYANAVMDIMKYGPEGLDPYLLLGGREQFAMTDIEDAGVLAAAFASKTDLLVTDNLNDFEIKDCTGLDTRAIETSSGRRQLRAMRHRRGAIDVIVAHPFDVMDWLRRGFDFEPAKLWDDVSASARGDGGTNR